MSMLSDPSLKLSNVLSQVSRPTFSWTKLWNSSVNDSANVLVFLKYIPFELKVGSWSPMMYLVLYLFSGFIFLTINEARADYSLHSSAYELDGKFLEWYRLLGGIYGVIIIIGGLSTLGVWIMYSYTLTSWNLMTLRLVSSFLAMHSVPGAAFVADTVRLAALTSCCITVLIWWTVLTPLITFLIQGDVRELQFFWRFSLSIGMLNVHLLNLPIVALEFLLTNRVLTFFDLWCSLFAALIYCMIYLGVLDARGLHFYIMFSPRTYLCVISFAVIICSYFGSYLFWSQVLNPFHEFSRALAPLCIAEGVCVFPPIES
jgi:hypothetical protein